MSYIIFIFHKKLKIPFLFEIYDTLEGIVDFEEESFVFALRFG